MEWLTQDKKIAVTGGAGLIGSNLCNTLHRKGYKVLAIDNFEKGKREYLDPGIEVRKVDLRYLYPNSGLFHGCDTVIHLASKVGGIGYYLKNAYEVMKDNILIDSNTLECAISNRVHKYLYASSAHIYPKSLQTSRDPVSIEEDQDLPADPGLSYGWAKMVGEKQLMYASKEGKIKSAIARYVGVYGETQSYELDTGSVIPVMCHRAVKYPDIPFTLWGDGKETRTYCYVQDAIDATMRMLGKLEDPSRHTMFALNIGNNSFNYSIDDIAKKIIKISGKDIPINYDESRQAVIQGQRCSVSNAYQQLDWCATTNLDEGLKKIYKDVEKRLQSTSQENS